MRPFAEALPIVGNRYAGTRDQVFGERLLREADNPDALDRALSPGPMRPGDDLDTSIIPGSKPTLGQFSGDMGILQAERQARTADIPRSICGTPIRARCAFLLCELRPRSPIPCVCPSEFFQQQRRDMMMALVLTDKDNRKRAA